MPNEAFGATLASHLCRQVDLDSKNTSCLQQVLFYPNCKTHGCGTAITTCWAAMEEEQLALLWDS